MRARALLAAAVLALGTAGVVAGAEAAGDRASYIVVLRPGVADVPAAAASMARTVGGDVGFVYQHSVRGFSITMSAAGAAALARNPRVAYVEADQKVELAVQDTPTGITRIYDTANASVDIDQVDDLRVDVDVAVIDTGIDLQHPDLNVKVGVTCTNGILWASCSSGGDDDHYHGTHVAGTIGALDNDTGVVGVAPGARLWPVKVLNSQGSGYTSWIVAGIDWVAANSNTIEVANMSLGGAGTSTAERDAIAAAVNKGVAFAVAAGNDDADASGYSPATFDGIVLTVSALADFNGAPGGGAAATCRADQDDTLADFSNWGPEVEIAAPGVCIRSTYPIERGSYGTISGTSMASPHVAGALALLASASNPSNSTDVTTLYSRVIAAGNFGWTDDSGDGIKEPLLDVRTFAATTIPGPGTSDPPPTVSLTGSSVTTGRTWTATATLRGAVGTVLTGKWNGTGSDVTCTVLTTTCSVSKTGISKKTASVTFVPSAPAGLPTLVITKP